MKNKFQMLGNIFAPKSEKNCHLILDFATNNLKLLLVASTYNNSFQFPVFAHQIIPHDLTLEQILDGDFETLRQKITKALSSLYNQSPFHIVSCICGLEDSFFESQFFTSSFQLNSEYPIDMGKLQNILQQAQSQARIGVLKKAQKKFQDPNLKLIQSDLIDIRIDNKSVKNPLGLSGSNVSVIFFNAFCQQKLFESLTSLTKYIGFELEHIMLQPISQAQISSNTQKLLVVELSHSKTSITLSKEGRLLKNKILDFGTQNIINQFADRFNFQEDDAKHALIAYCNDNFHKEYRDMRKTVLIGANNLLQEIKQVMSEFKLFDMQKVQIKLMGGGACIPEITEVLESKFKKYGQVNAVKTTDFQFVCDPTGQLSDPGLIATLAYANRFLSDKHKDADSVAKANINKILRLTTVE